MSYEVRFHCDLCEQASAFVSHIANVTPGRMLILGTENLGEICTDCVRALTESVESRRAKLSAVAAPHREPSKARKTRVI